MRFGTIRNNTALKQNHALLTSFVRFGTIRNNTALKHASPDGEYTYWFWNHSKQHSSKTF